MRGRKVAIALLVAAALAATACGQAPQPQPAATGPQAPLTPGPGKSCLLPLEVQPESAIQVTRHKRGATYNAPCSFRDAAQRSAWPRAAVKRGNLGERGGAAPGPLDSRARACALRACASARSHRRRHASLPQPNGPASRLPTAVPRCPHAPPASPLPPSQVSGSLERPLAADITGGPKAAVRGTLHVAFSEGEPCPAPDGLPDALSRARLAAPAGAAGVEVSGLNASLDVGNVEVGLTVFEPTSMHMMICCCRPPSMCIVVSALISVQGGGPTSTRRRRFADARPRHRFPAARRWRRCPSTASPPR